MKVCGGLSTALIAAMLAFGAPAAMAQLPGGSAADAYTENVPGAGGDQPSGGGGSNASDNGGGTGTSAQATSCATTASSSPSGNASQTAAGGANGVDASGQPTAGSASGGATSTRGGQPPEVPATLTSQPVPVATDQPGNGGGISPAWPIALTVVLLASVGIYWYRRRYPETLIGPRPGRLAQRSLG
jgi:hypothetical protein